MARRQRYLVTLQFMSIAPTISCTFTAAAHGAMQVLDMALHFLPLWGIDAMGSIIFVAMIDSFLAVIPPVRGVTPAVAQLSFTLRF